MTKYSIITTKEFDTAFKKLDNSVQKQIKHWIDNHLVNTDDPKAFGKPLVGDSKGYWRYRIGDYRLITEIDGNKLIIVMINIGHRKNIYIK